MIDYMLSIASASMSNAQPQDCYCNAWEALARMLHMGFYIEGWAVLELDDEVQLIEHGWCTLPDGRIIDPTVIFLVGPDMLISYFPGVEYSYDETLSFEGEMLPQVRFTQYGDDGMEHPDYKAAYLDRVS